MTFDTCTFDLTGATFVECGIAVGLDDMRVDGRGLEVGTWTLGAGHVFLAESAVIGQSAFLRDDLGCVCFFPNDISFDLACSTLMYLLR